MFRKTIIAASAACLASITPASAKTMIIVLPGDYAGQREDLVRLAAVEATAIKAPDRVIFYDARSRKQIATIAVPDHPNAVNPAWVRNQIAAQFAAVRQAIEAMPPVPPAGEIGSNIHIVDVLDEIGRNVVPSLPERAADILLIGSRMYHDVRDARFSMTNRAYPADAHLKGNPSDTPFSTIGRETLLKGGTIHLCSPRDEFVNRDHDIATARWWSLYLKGTGATVGTISFDIAQCFRRMRSGEFSGQATYTSMGGTKLEMLRVHAAIPAVAPASQEKPGEYFLADHAVISTTPPTTTTGIAWIGLRWKAAADVDLYARGDASKPWIFFASTQSSEGRFNKDHRSATGETQFEFIEFTAPITLGKAEIMINLYEGQLAASPEGVVRVWWEGKVYEAPFRIPATRGNGGAAPMTGPHWVKIDLRKVVGLTP